MSSLKRKRTNLTLTEKKEIIHAAKKEPNQSKLAREMSKKWGIEVKKTTVKGILSKKDAIEAAIKAGIPSKPLKLKPGHNIQTSTTGCSYGWSNKRTESACRRRPGARIAWLGGGGGEGAEINFGGHENFI